MRLVAIFKWGCKLTYNCGSHHVNGHFRNHLIRGTFRKFGLYKAFISGNIPAKYGLKKGTDVHPFFRILKFQLILQCEARKRSE